MKDKSPPNFRRAFILEQVYFQSRMEVENMKNIKRLNF